MTPNKSTALLSCSASARLHRGIRKTSSCLNRITVKLLLLEIISQKCILGLVGSLQDCSDYNQLALTRIRRQQNYFFFLVVHTKKNIRNAYVFKFFLKKKNFRVPVQPIPSTKPTSLALRKIMTIFLFRMFQNMQTWGFQDSIEFLPSNIFAYCFVAILVINLRNGDQLSLVKQ